MSSLSLLKDLSGHRDRVWGLSWSPCGHLLASCSGDKTLCVWGSAEVYPPVSSETTQPPSQPEVAGTDVDMDANANANADVDVDVDVNVGGSVGGSVGEHVLDEDFAAFDCAAVLTKAHTKAVRSCYWSGDGKYLASASFDGTTVIWTRKDVKRVCWSPDGQTLFSCGYDETIRVWMCVDEEWTCVQVLTGNSSTVWAVSISEDGMTLASGCGNGEVKLYKRFEHNGGKGKYIWKQQMSIASPGKFVVYDVSWGEKGLLATASQDDMLRLYSLEELSSDKNPKTFGGHPSFSSHGLRAYNMALDEGSFHGTLKLVAETRAHDGDVNRVVWNPNRSDILATAGDDMKVRIWKLG